MNEFARRRVLDVSHLPTYAFGPRDSHWWGTILGIVIEGTMMALLLAAYFYLRKNFEVFPPVRYSPQGFTAATVGTAVLALSLAPAVLASRAAKRESLKGMRLGVAGMALLGVAFLATRWVEFSSLPFFWDQNAYASLFWALLGLHAIHVGVGVVECFVVLALLFRGPVEKKHLCDVDVTAIVWIFAGLEWIPVYAILYFDPMFFAH